MVRAGSAPAEFLRHWLPVSSGRPSPPAGLPQWTRVPCAYQDNQPGQAANGNVAHETAAVRQRHNGSCVLNGCELLRLRYKQLVRSFLHRLGRLLLRLEALSVNLNKMRVLGSQVRQNLCGRNSQPTRDGGVSPRRMDSRRLRPQSGLLLRGAPLGLGEEPATRPAPLRA